MPQSYYHPHEQRYCSRRSERTPRLRGGRYVAIVWIPDSTLEGDHREELYPSTARLTRRTNIVVVQQVANRPVILAMKPGLRHHPRS